ncbi:aldolase [Priestia aryabhattai]|uniref:aldolase n=1 Tax=Priestia TaxID=2800373 RepID=UPI00263AE85D|nr:aldolase [Priestia megaterium]MDN4861135.1 aldolase [Priestia megaterium]
MISIKKNYAYCAFGLNISSEIPLPELDCPVTPDANIDAFIKVLSSSEITIQLESKKGFTVYRNEVTFEVPNTALFSIRNGTEIIVVPLEEFDKDRVRLYVLGTCMGVLLMQQQILPLHGSAIAINGKAYAIVGNSGAGKSTLASAFIREGYELLSDDVIPVTFSSNNIPIVQPSYPQQKLWEESLNEFGMDTRSYKPLFERETKYSIPVKDSFYNQPLPLGGIFELIRGNGESVEIRKADGLERFRILLHHTFRGSLLQKLGLKEWHFIYSSNILKEVQTFHLTRPISKFTPYDLVSKILNNMKEGNLND